MNHDGDYQLFSSPPSSILFFLHLLLYPVLIATMCLRICPDIDHKTSSDKAGLGQGQTLGEEQARLSALLTSSPGCYRRFVQKK